MQYIYKRVNDTYVVWFGSSNRYMQLQEPAFRVLEDWADQLPEGQIIRNCALEFRLGLQLARRFVREVTGQLQKLKRHYREPGSGQGELAAHGPVVQSWFSTRHYLIGGRRFRFRYADAELQGLIHPGFAYLEQPARRVERAYGFDLWRREGQLALQTGGPVCWQCDDTRGERFVGRVYLQLLNRLYGATDGSWMGAVHASAIATNQGAVLLTAPSGGGKSTLAALLMSRGYKVLADDFSPLWLDPVRVVPFPEAISVKSQSLQVLRPSFPGLFHGGDEMPGEVHLPLSGGGQPAPVRAIVFLEYAPLAAPSFGALANLEAMDRFMRQLWLAPTLEVATHFMDWYFQVPCFGLRYADPEKAVRTLSQHFI